MIKRAEKLVGDIACFLENHSGLMIAFAMAVYFLKSLMQGLIKGGRWDLYQNIAMADRLYALIKLGERFSQNRAISLVVTFTLVSMGFEHYRDYMNEFKADSLVLLYAVLIILIIDKIENNERNADTKTALRLFVMAFLMDVTKQQALYVDVALGIYLLFTKKFKIKEKIVILGSLATAGLVDLAVIFRIPGVEIQTISVGGVSREMAGGRAGFRRGADSRRM